MNLFDMLANPPTPLFPPVIKKARIISETYRPLMEGKGPMATADVSKAAGLATREGAYTSLVEPEKESYVERFTRQTGSIRRVYWEWVSE